MSVDEPARLGGTSSALPETAWLIERGQSENHAPTVWFVEGHEWTTDANLAARFAMEADADDYIRRFISAHAAHPTARATEHVFLPAVGRPVRAEAARAQAILDTIEVYENAVSDERAGRIARDVLALVADLERAESALAGSRERNSDLHADLAVARAELERVTRERDLAIAHDTQPYPTAWAYEQVCKASCRAQARVEALEARLRHAGEATQ